MSAGLDLADAAGRLATEIGGASRRRGGYRLGDRLRGQRSVSLADSPDPRVELNRLTGRLRDEVPPHCRRITDLDRDPFPPVEVVEVPGGWRVHAPGRVRGSTAQSAVIHPDRRSAEAAAATWRAGMVLAETQAVAARVAAMGGGSR